MTSRRLLNLPSFVNKRGLLNEKSKVIDVESYMKVIFRNESTKKCEEKCDHPRFKRIKKLQSNYQGKETCPVWLMSTTDKCLYYATIISAAVGFGYSVYSNLVILNS